MKLRILVSTGLIVVLLGAATGAALLLIGLRKSPPKHQPARVAQKVVAPPQRAAADHVIQVVGYGSVRPRVQLNIIPRVGGEVIERSERFYSGRTVRGGDDPDVLFRIDPEPYDLDVVVARQRVAMLAAQMDRLDQDKTNLTAIEAVEAEQVVLSQRQLERNREVVASMAGTDNELELAEAALLVLRKQLQITRNQLAALPQRRRELQAELNSAQADLKRAELHRKWTEVRSPVDGRIIDCDVEVGESVRAGDICGALYSTEIMEIPVSVPAGDLQWLAEDGDGMSEATVVWTEPLSGTTYRWAGTLDRREAGLQAGTRTAVLVVRVDNTDQPPPTDPASLNGRPLLDLNMYCKVVVDGRRVARAFLLPRSAIQPSGFVYVAVDGRLAMREVTVARYTAEQALILPGGGLAEADRVILSYVPRPVDGMSVTVVDAEPARAVAERSDE